jgi:hypothetical protein
MLFGLISSTRTAVPSPKRQQLELDAYAQAIRDYLEKAAGSARSPAEREVASKLLHDVRALAAAYSESRWKGRLLVAKTVPPQSYSEGLAVGGISQDLASIIRQTRKILAFSDAMNPDIVGPDAR